jgi:carboxylesterase type B
MIEVFVLILTTFFIDGSLGIVGGRKSAVPPLDDPVVFVNYAGRFARVEGYRDRGTNLYTFRGLKYADPPIRENRFLRPKYKRLVGDVDAKKYGPPCPQPDYYDENKIIGDEDCLILNIFTPKMPDEMSGLPVFLWIHGGGYRYGSANQYEAYPIIQNDVVFVPIQYRLGTLGLLGDGTKEFGGNVALFDMHAALRWVKEYIHFFGGDPEQIKIMGHGSGASGAMYLSQSPIGRSLLNGVVAMSGSSLSQYSYDEEPTQSIKEIGEINDCPYNNDTSLIKCMQSKSVEDIVKRDSKVQTERLIGQHIIKAMSGMLSFSPNLESQDDQRGLPGVIIEKPEDFLKKPNDIKMPLLIGMTEHETANGIDQKEIENIFKSGTEFLKSVGSAVNLKKILGDKIPTNNLKSLTEGLSKNFSNKI